MRGAGEECGVDLGVVEAGHGAGIEPERAGGHDEVGALQGAVAERGRLIKNDICKLVSEIAQIDEYQTIIIVSHDIEPTLSIADTVWLVGKAENGSATIVESINLMEKGLCWEHNIEESPQFQQMCGYVTKRFKDLNG